MDKAGSLLAVALVFAFASTVLEAQNVLLKPPATDLFDRWDDLNHRVLYHRASVTPSVPAIYVADAQGNLSVAIDVLKDFPGAIHGFVGAENAAGGPNGSIVLFCILDYGVRPLKELILIYSASGVLTSTIDTASYEAAALATDEAGNIYIFASNSLYDVDDPKAVYDTVVKYDSAGHISKTMLPSSNFPVGDDPTGCSPQNGGEPLLRVTPKGIAVFAASSGKWFLLSQQGEILTQSDVSRVTRKIADHYQFRSAFIYVSFIDPEGLLVFGVRLDDGPFDEGNVPPPDQRRFWASLVRINPSTGEFTEIKNDARLYGAMILGINASGNLVFGIRQKPVLYILRHRVPPSRNEA